MQVEHKIVSRYFVLLCSPNNLQYPRLAMAVSKKHFAKAVDRAKIKRIIRESYRYNQLLIKGTDILVIAKQSISSSNNKSLRAHLDQQWIKLR